MHNRLRTTLLLSLTALVALWAVVALALPGKSFEGKPPYKPGSVLGALVWQDASGIHLCSSAKGKARQFKGTISASGGISEFGGHHMEPNDTVTRLSPDKITFSFKTMGNNDCVVFQGAGDTITFQVDMAGKPLPPAHIFVGAKGVHPKANPFVLKSSDK